MVQHLQPVGEQPWHPIGIADAHHRQAAGALGGEAMAVAHSRAGRHLPNQAHPRPHLHGRLQRQAAPQVRRRPLAVEGQTHAHHVVVELGGAQGAGGIGQVTAATGQAGLLNTAEHLLEALLLLTGERIEARARGIGIRQVGVEPGELHRL